MDVDRVIAIAKRFRSCESMGEVRELVFELNKALAPKFELLELTSPRPGRVKAVWSKPGEVLQRGQALIVLEPGAVSDQIVVPKDGTVDRVLVSPGDEVKAEQLLAKLKSPWDGDIAPDAPDAPKGTDEPPPRAASTTYENF